MSARTSLSRHQWQQAALTSYFGEEPEVGDPWSRLSDALASFTALTSETLRAAVSDAASLDASAMELLGGARGQDSTPVADLDRRRPLRVVLMGRTMAGKSSLLAALTGSHHNRIGDGRQRFSRDTLGARTLMSEHLEVIDTPGVGAYGGADDTDTAVTAALDADVVVWVNSSDSIQEESAATLRLLAPVIHEVGVVLGC